MEATCWSCGTDKVHPQKYRSAARSDQEPKGTAEEGTKSAQRAYAEGEQAPPKITPARKLKINAKSAGGIPATCSRSSMVEQLPCKQLAVGSNPTGCSILSFSQPPCY